MNKNKISPKTGLFFLLIIAALLFTSGSMPVQAQSDDEPLQGWFTIIYGDASPENPATPQTVYMLTTGDGKQYQLELGESMLAEAGGALALNRQWIEIESPEIQRADQEVPFVVFADSISIESSPQQLEPEPATYGTRPWVSILCKFNDFTAEPKTLDYFLGMFGDSYPGLNHYWREVSYNQVNINGSTALGWFNLPQPRAYYVPQSGTLNWDRAARDCTAAADASIDFRNYSGINLMFNADLDGYAWGGSHCLTLDGVSRCWQMTWEPPWGYKDITVIAHEMGHGFGLPHSSGAYGKTYDNQWDVMSDTWSNCSRSRDAVYGCLGQHTISYHKDILGWIPATRKYTVPYGTGAPSDVVFPESQPFLMVQIPKTGSIREFYTLEARIQYGYDVKLPGQAIVIHDIAPINRDYRPNPAHVVDIDGNGNTGDAGAMWVAGETFQDAGSQISVSVLAFTANRYQVLIKNGSQSATLWLESLAQPLGIFADVPNFYWAKDYIAKLYYNGITGGCTLTPLSYCPEAPVTRGQMAVFVEKSMRGSGYVAPETPATFGDTTNHWAKNWIERLKSDGITAGCGNGNFCPEANVTRAEMAVFLLKAKNGIAYNPPAATGTMFSDVPTGYWAASWIEQLAIQGITGGCGTNLYCPNNQVTRAEMAVFLVKTFNLP